MEERIEDSKVSRMREHTERSEIVNHKRGSGLVAKRGVKLEAYEIFRTVYSEWKRNPRLSFQIACPVTYVPSEEMLERTWLEGKKALVIYFLTPEKLSRIVYGIKPSIYVEKSAEFLAWLHNLRKASRHIDVRALQRRHITQMKIIVNSCLESRLISENTADNIKHITDRISEHEGWGPVSIIHGDFNTHNVLIAKENLAIIDFEMTRYDFSYLDLARFVYNIKLRSNKYPFAKESRLNSLASIFLGKYQELCGEIDRKALVTCYFTELLEQLRRVLRSYSMKNPSLRESISSFLTRMNLDYIVKEISLLGSDLECPQEQKE